MTRRRSSAIVRSHDGPESLGRRRWTIHRAGAPAGRSGGSWALSRRVQAQPPADRCDRRALHRSGVRDLPAPAQDVSGDLEARAQSVRAVAGVLGRPVDPARPRDGEVLAHDRPLLAAAAKNGLTGETVKSLRDKVQASVDQEANVISIVGTDDTARGAAAIANVVAATFLARERRQQQKQVRKRAPC